MLLAGDEFCNTQYGNNNPYCQDNEISWLDWTMLEKHKDIFNFVKKVIRFRKEHPIIRSILKPSGFGFPDVSFHGVEPWADGFESYDHYIGVMFAGITQDDEEDVVYIGLNTYWEPLTIHLPRLPEGHFWNVAVNTNIPDLEQPAKCDNTFFMGQRSVAVFIAK